MVRMRRTDWRARTSAIVIVAVAAFAGTLAEAQSHMTVHGVATIERSTCCGGAMVRPGRVCSASEAYSGEITVRPGTRNVGRVVAHVRVSSGGAFSLNLAPGTYCLVGDVKAGGAGRAGQRGQVAAETDANRDPECMQRYMSECESVIHVPSTARVEVRIQQGCFGPCYRGPMPP